MAVNFNDLYAQAQNVQAPVDPTSRKGILDMLMSRNDPSQEALAGALDNPNGKPSVGAAGLQDAMGKPTSGPLSQVTDKPNAANNAYDQMNAPSPGGATPMQGGPPIPSVSPQSQLSGAQGLSGYDRPVPTPQAPQPMSGQPSRLPQANAPGGPGGALGGPSPASASPVGTQQMAPQNPGISGNIGAPPPPLTPRDPMPSVAPPKPPGGMPGAMPGMQGANGQAPQPQLDPKAVEQIGQASPQAMQQTMQLMQKTWEQQQMKNRMAMGRQ